MNKTDFTEKKTNHLEAIAESVTDTGGVYFVPAFSGLFAPYWRSDARGSFLLTTTTCNIRNRIVQVLSLA
jgi:glycerol kinase